MFSVIKNIYNKKTKGPTLMELFTATGKLFFFYKLEMFDLCTHRYYIQVLATPKKNFFFSFPVAVNNSIKVGPMVFLL